MLAAIAFAVGRSDARALDVALTAAIASDAVDARDIGEALLQGIPFAGFPGAIDGFSRLRELLGDVGGAHPTEAAESSAATGSQQFEAVYGDLSERVLEQLASFAPELHDWILDFAYGRVMGRTHFSLAEIEALGVASLLGQRRATPLHSHLRGALRQGWGRDELRRFVDGFRAELGDVFAQAVDRVLERLLGAATSGDSPPLA